MNRRLQLCPGNPDRVFMSSKKCVLTQRGLTVAFRLATAFVYPTTDYTERDAIHGVLEKYGLIEWTRGGKSRSACKREKVL